MKTLEKAKINLFKKGYLDLEIPHDINLIQEINYLKKQKNAIILSHYYQYKTIQNISDYLGDSLQLARQAKETAANLIIFCGVYFMAEAAKILSPTKKVLVPDLFSGCSLADSCTGKDIKNLRKKYPNSLVISYINCNADVKAETDIIVTSSNAEIIINSLPKNKNIIFVPDKNLGIYLNKKTGRNMILWNGVCIVHEAFSIEKIAKQIYDNPDAEFIAHPENQLAILELAKFVGSTSQLIKYVKNSNITKFIIGTEEGVIHEMKKQAPNKIFISALTLDESCSCSECFYMKRNTLEKIYLCLKYELPEILIDNKLRIKALKPIKKMLELSKHIK